MDAELAALPDDVDALKAALLAARADVAAARAEQSGNLALIAHLRLQIQKLNRDRFGPRSERTARLLDQMERIHPVRTTAQLVDLRLVDGLRVHALASAATAASRASTSTTLGS